MHNDQAGALDLCLTSKGLRICFGSPLALLAGLQLFLHLPITLRHLQLCSTDCMDSISTAKTAWVTIQIMA